MSFMYHILRLRGWLGFWKVRILDNVSIIYPFILIDVFLTSGTYRILKNILEKCVLEFQGRVLGILMLF